MSRSYSRSRSRSPVARKSRSRSPARRQERSRSREASPEKIMYSIVVSDLPADIRESELERKFEQFGKIGDVFMPKDRYRRVKVTVIHQRSISAIFIRFIVLNSFFFTLFPLRKRPRFRFCSIFREG